MTHRLLVAGGAGFIGSHIVDAALAAGWAVEVVDDLSTGKRASLPAGVKLHPFDVRGPEARRLVAWVKSSPPITAGTEVLAPGDVERRTRAERLEGGVPLDDKTWTDLLDAARSVGIGRERAAALVRD